MIGIELGCKGPNYGLVSACATGSHALGEALSALQRGDADAMLAGGVEVRERSLSARNVPSLTRTRCSPAASRPRSRR